MIRAELTALVQTLGQPVVFLQAKPPATSTAIAKCATQSTSKAMEPIVNAYGVNGREFIILQRDLTTAPEKFDAVSFQGERYVLDTVVPLHEHGTGALMGWRAFSRGK